MERLELLNAPPILSKWTVKYDTLFNMPMYIQGVLINDYDELVAGDNVVLDDILALDLKQKKVHTYSDEIFLLVGPGQQMILIDEEAPGKGIIWEAHEDLIPEN